MKQLDIRLNDDLETNEYSDFSLEDELSWYFYEQVSPNFNLKEVAKYFVKFSEEIDISIDNIKTKIQWSFDELIKKANKDFEKWGFFDKRTYSPFNPVWNAQRDWFIQALHDERNELFYQINALQNQVTEINAALKTYVSNYEDNLKSKDATIRLFTLLKNKVDAIQLQISAMNQPKTWSPFDDLWRKEYTISQKEKQRIMNAIESTQNEIEAHVTEVKDNLLAKATVQIESAKKNLTKDLNSMLGTTTLSFEEIMNFFEVIQKEWTLFMQMNTQWTSPSSLIDVSIDSTQIAATNTFEWINKYVELLPTDIKKS